MSAEKLKHDYHLVDPSPWPIYVSFSCLVLAVGCIYYMHAGVSWAMYLGFAFLIYGAYMWFRDVIIEADGPFGHLAKRDIKRDADLIEMGFNEVWHLKEKTYKDIKDRLWQELKL